MIRLAALLVTLGFVHALVAQSDGQQRWAFSTLSSSVAGNILSSPAIGTDGTVYVGIEIGSASSATPGGRLMAIRPDGTLKWSFDAPDWIDSAPAIAPDGTLYFGCWNGRVYAVRADGSQAWSFQTGGFIAGSPALGPDGTVYVGSGDGNLYAILDGALKWTFPAIDWIDSSPAIGPDGTIYFGCWDNSLYAVTSTGALKWKFTATDSISSSPCIAADGTVYVGSRSGTLYAITRDGLLKWMYGVGDIIEASPVIGPEGVVYISSLEGRVFAIRADGTEAWRYPRADQPALQPIYATAAVRADGSIILGTNDNAVIALNADGTLRWSTAVGDWADSSPAVGADGSIYIGCTDKRLYSLYGTQPLATTEWPLHRRDSIRNAWQVHGRIPATTGRLMNLSARAIAGSGSDTLIAGFVVGGSGGRSVLVRGVGSTLQELGVTGALADPQLTAFSGGTPVAHNDNWGAAPNALEIAATAASVGAFPLPVSSLDAALLNSFSSGPFTVHVTGSTETAGVALMELYDAGGGDTGRLVNVSARSRVGIGGDILIIGFVIGSDSRCVMIRAIGPGLTELGVPGVLDNPILRLFKGSRIIAENDDWGRASNAAELASVGHTSGAFSLLNTSRDSILLVTLPPGVYTAHIVGAGDTTGVALAEAYAIE